MVKTVHWPRVINNKLVEYDLSLTRMKKMLDLIGNPHLKVPPVIHVGGTNGKGSTVSFIRHVLEKSGYKVHSYISPHIIEFNERIVLAGSEIEDCFLYDVLEECRVCADKGNLITSFFEGITAAAFLAFSRIHADFLILEVGLGGVSDATNVIDNTEVSVITRVDFDHMEYLGDSIRSIAVMKSGIIKKEVPCVVASQKYMDVLEVLNKVAEINNAPIYRSGCEWLCTKSGDGMEFRSSMYSGRFSLPSLIGNHQIDNSGNAIMACFLLKEKLGLDISIDSINEGIKSTYWPGRLQKVKTGALLKLIPSGWNIYIDGAHNPSGMEALSSWIESSGVKTYMIFGTTRGKVIKECMGAVKDQVEMVCTVCVKSEPRAERSDFINAKQKTLV